MKTSLKSILFLLLIILTVSYLTACGDDDDDDDSGDNTGDDDTGDDDIPDTFTCEGAGYPVLDFTDAEDDSALYATAADFTVNTTTGPWHFAEKWTGCETYLFIQDTPSQASGWDRDLFERDVETLLGKLPDNAQVFFMSDEKEEADRQTALDMVKEQADAFIADLTTDEQNRWFHRLHYVTDRSFEIEGWLGNIMLTPAWGAGIDRSQRIRYIGSYADYMRYDGSMGWFAPNISMAANESIYYNFEAEREQRLEGENATVIHAYTGEVLSDPGWAGTRHYADITFPDAATMAGFDTMEFDLYLGCEGDGEYGDCPAWDYIVQMYLCDAGDPETCTTEVGRWITTYHREGRWVHDVSALLPLLADGGARRLAFYTQQPYEVVLDVRLSNQGKGLRPVEATYLFSGGTFNPDYNTSYAPIEVMIPSDAEKVELATVISGHGGASPGNCAEFCNTTHHFLVNSNENVLDFPQAGGSDDCMENVANGTVPNQYGTWWYGRSGWCPGLEVPMVMTDVTDQVTPGQNNTFEYYGLYQGDPYPSDGASIVMTSWVVVYKNTK